MAAKTTPRAIISLFNFSKMPKATRSRMEPNVINLPSFPSAFIVSIPVIKSKSAKKEMNRKLPRMEAKIPIINPDNNSNLFIPFPGVELLNGVMCRQIKLYGNHRNETIGKRPFISIFSLILVDKLPC